MINVDYVFKDYGVWVTYERWTD